MTPQDQDDQDAALFNADQVLAERQAQEALDASATRPLTEHERAALAWAARLPNPNRS